MKCKNRWKQEINANCSVVSESQYRIMHTYKSRQNPWALTSNTVGGAFLYALYDIETQGRPNNSRWLQCVGKTEIISCFQRFLHFIWCANSRLLFELDTFASTYSRYLLPQTRGANGFRDRGHVVQSFSASPGSKKITKRHPNGVQKKTPTFFGCPKGNFLYHLCPLLWQLFAVRMASNR